jgi:AraC-like DNA-binding protein
MTRTRKLMLDRPAKLDVTAYGAIMGTMATLDPWAPADPLAEALHLLRMNGAFYCPSEFSAPWGLALPAMPGYMWFHVVTGGEVTVEAEAEVIPLRRGDLALVTRGTGHVLRGEAGAPTPGILELEREVLGDRYEILRHGGGGARSTMICGAVRFEHPAARNLIEILPEVIRIDGSDSPPADWMQSTLSLMASEMRRPRPGGEAVITRLADILVIQAIRSWIDTDARARGGWLGALRDPQIGRALALIHRHPDRAWTVASLADEVAMSRSAFAARFGELVGKPVIRYVTDWRMQVARAALQDGDTTVAELADRLGYRSEAAFARAFKRVIGVAPGSVRRAEDPAAYAGLAA